MNTLLLILKYLDIVIVNVNSREESIITFYPIIFWIVEIICRIKKCPSTEFYHRMILLNCEKLYK